MNNYNIEFRLHNVRIAQVFGMIKKYFSVDVFSVRTALICYRGTFAKIFQRIPAINL